MGVQCSTRVYWKMHDDERNKLIVISTAKINKKISLRETCRLSLLGEWPSPIPLTTLFVRKLYYYLKALNIYQRYEWDLLHQGKQIIAGLK